MMIKDNRILFGYGSVSVGSLYNHLMFKEIKPPIKIGDNADEAVANGETEYTGEQRDIYFKSYEEIRKFERLLYNNLINEDEDIVEYNGLILDFHKWDDGSYKVMLFHIERIKKSFLPIMAC